MLIATLLRHGISTFTVGSVPGYDVIGIWGAVLLTVLRLIQGIGVGGEWGGSVLLAMEWARTNNSGLHGLLAAVRRPRRVVPGQLAVLAFSAVSGDGFLAWGWRIPFLLSTVLVGIGLWIRLVSSRRRCSAARRRISGSSATPVLEVSAPAEADHPHRACADARAGAVLHLHRLHLRLWHQYAASFRDLLLSGRAAGLLHLLVAIPLSGHVSDRIGRKKYVHYRRRRTGVFGFVYFALLDTRARPDFHRPRAVAHSARHVTARRRPDRRMLHEAAAV